VPKEENDSPFDGTNPEENRKAAKKGFPSKMDKIG
jgi:hypothetical protein